MISVLMAVSFVGLLVLGLPLAFAAGAIAVIFALVLYGPPGLALVVSRVFTLLGNSVLVSVPLFVFMACLLERSGIAEDIFSAVTAWAGNVPGGLAVAVIITSTLMAAMVGVLGAEVVTIGIVALPAMLARGYKKDLALGCICAGGGLSTLIPPSVVFILYGLTAGVSIGQLYIAGIIPGLMLAAMYIAYIVIRAWLDPSIAPRALSVEASLPLAAESRAAGQAVPAFPGRVRGPGLAVPGLGDADRGRRRRRAPARHWRRWSSAGSTGPACATRSPKPPAPPRCCTGCSSARRR